ncbi:MAG: tRNA pseudouridine(13) synthase TruD [Candidatus Aminicenantes bacterium]|nr:tRNA pseudouridine(13) synthase TruD [Candidatus Aminicenantes bacterium]
MIKARPEDFIVEERADPPLSPNGRFGLYRLSKSGWNTTDLVRHLAGRLRLPPDRFAYGGKKDKHGRTSQYLTIDDPAELCLEGANFRLEPAGRMDRPMGPDLIRSNGFTVVIRDLAGLEQLGTALEEVRTWGVPNWFDDQRFRSYDPERGFFAEKILRRHWNGALQVFLTSITPGLAGREKIRRAELFRHWRDWKACRALAADALERTVFDVLRNRPEDFSEALHRIPEEETSMQFAAFQAHLWNELLRRLIRSREIRVKEHSGREGPYLFWIDGREADKSGLPALRLPTAAARMDFADPEAEALFNDILRERSLSRAAFRTKDLRRVRFQSFLRPAVVVPGDFQVLDRGEDELHPGRKKIALRFDLPRGSYATILVKRLTLMPFQ